MTEKRKKLGNEGEQAAAEYLEMSGYKILERNLRLFCGEIDILAEDVKDKKSIVIVEVKTVSGDGWGEAIDLVRYKKQNKLKLLASVLSQQYPNKTIRIDVIGVSVKGIEHLKNAVN